jgi:recombination protein RecR
MQAVPPALERLITDLAKLPGIGRKTATRLALYILRRPASEAQVLVEDLAALHTSIRLCRSCFAFSEADPCLICSDARRDAGLVCVVEEPGDMISIEKTGVFRGVYHILHGVLSPMDGIGPPELKIRELFARVRQGGVRAKRPPPISWNSCTVSRCGLPVSPAVFPWAWISNMPMSIPWPGPSKREGWWKAERRLKNRGWKLIFLT